jgi:hypothetical protein
MKRNQKIQSHSKPFPDDFDLRKPLSLDSPLEKEWHPGEADSGKND